MAFGRLGGIGAGFGRIGAGFGGGAVAAAGGALLLLNETNGLGIDFTHATDTQRVATKFSGVVASYGLDEFFQNSGTSPKRIFDVTGALIWAPHNMFLNSGVPVTQSVTTLVGATYTVTVTGSGSMTGSAGAAGVATAGAPLTYVATTTTSTFTKAGTVTQIQMNRGSVATAYLATTAAARYGVAIDYHPSTHVCRGMLVEAAGTNLLLNCGTLSTQSVTVTAVAHTLSFLGTGTITLTGVSTAGPLVGTGATDRVSLTFTPTAGSLTLTVTGTVSNAQLETGAFATSHILTFGTTVTRAGDNFTFLLSTIPALGSTYSMLNRFSTPSIASGRYVAILCDGTLNEMASARPSTTAQTLVIDGGVVQATLTHNAVVADTPITVAMRIEANNIGGSTSGNAATTDLSATLPTIDQMRFSSAGSGGPSLGWQHMQKLVIVPRSWSNAELAAQSATT